MAYSGLLTDYLGEGLASARPTTPNLSPGACGIYYSTDTAVLNVWDGSAWHTFAAGGGGTVTSVGLTAPAQLTVTGSPVTTAGAIALAWANQNANLIFAGPASGSAAAPTLRSLVAADLPLGTTSAPGALQPDGTTITVSSGVISAAGGSGGPAYVKALQSGYYVSFARGIFTTLTMSVGALAANGSIAAPIRILANCSITPVLEVTTAAVAGHLAYALYNVDPATGLPGTKVADFAALDTSATGLKTSTTTLAVTAGDYYIFFNQSVTVSVRFAASYIPLPDWGIPTTVLTSSGSMMTLLTATLTYSATAPSTLVGQTWTPSSLQAWVPFFAVS